MALVLHELMANAIRHGALRTASGSLSVEWTCSGQSLGVAWRESGAIGVVQPKELGVGLKMLENVVKRQLGGVATLRWARDGLHADLSLPLAKGASS